MEEEILGKKISEVESLLEEYTEKKLLLNKIQIVDARVNITTDELAKMSSEELNNWRLEVAQYILYIQKEINKHKSRRSWADRVLDYYLSKKVHDNFGECQGFRFEEKKMDMYRNDNYAQKLNDLATKSQAALDRLEFLPGKLLVLCEIAKDMIWSRKERYNAEKNNE